MSAADTAVTILGHLFSLARQIADAVEKGATDEEIMQRITAPGGVAQDILDAVRDRKSKFRYPGAKS